jgi:hypothetical protein
MKNLQERVEELIDGSFYDEAAALAAKEIGFKLESKFKEYGKHFDGDADRRDIYRCTITKGTRAYSFNFGQSINCSGEYIGHKHMCCNKFGKDRFTKDEFNKNRYFNRDCDIKPNKNFSEPTLYSIIACLTKYNPETFEDFCSEFGYDEDSKKAEKIYDTVLEEWNAVQALFSDEELEILNTIN